MKKLKLQLEKIEVYSFAVETQETGGGTVKGYSTSLYAQCGTNVLDSCTSCFPQDCPRMPLEEGG